MVKKLFICPWFGELPNWFPQYEEHIKHLKQYGYDFLIDTDLDGFKKRCMDKLGIVCNIVPGTGKIHDFRAMLGVLYAEEIKGYDFWGHTDFDCVYGRVDRFITDELLSNLDVHSNHSTYVCGPWTLYRNTPEVNELFKQYPEWRFRLLDQFTSGWVEREFSRTLENSGLRFMYTFWQGRYDIEPNLKMDEQGGLFQDGHEIMMYHFRRRKRWPMS